MLVSLQQAKAHLRVDTSDEDTHIALLTEAASGAVLNYLKDDSAAFLDSYGDVMDSNGEPIGVPREVQSATLLMLGYLYKDRDGDPENAYEMGYLPKPVTALLYPLRTPALR
jgi:hypothetical protein